MSASARRTGIDSNTRFEYDVQGKGLQVMTTGLSASWGNAANGTSTANVNISRIQPESSSTPTGSISGGTVLSFVQGRVKGGYSLTWDIARSALLNQGVSWTYLSQCCGIQADFQKYKYPQTSTGFPIAVGSPLQRVVRARGARHLLEFLRRLRRPDGSRTVA